MKYFVLILLAFMQVVLAVVLGYRKHSKVSRAFIFFAVNMALWTCVNAALDFCQYQIKAEPGTLDVLNRLGFFLGTTSLFFAYRLSLVFPLEKLKTKLTISITIAGAVIPILTLLPQVSGYFTSSATGDVAEYHYGQFVSIIGIYTLVLFVASAANIFAAFKSVEYRIKKQAITVFFGLLVSIFFGVFFITVLPIITGNEKLLFLGYYAPFIFTASIFYSIVKQQFLDFKLIVVRSLGYILSLVTVGLISFLTLTYLTGYLDITGVDDSVQRVIYVALTLALATSYQPFKRAFDRLTRKLFYRDAYDTQDLLNEFNETIVSTIDLRQLLERSGVVIEKYIKPDASVFAVRDSEGDTVRLISAENPNLSKEVIEQVRGYVHKNSNKLFVTDGLEENDRDLKMLLQEANIGMLARITTDAAVEGSGYVILGYKKSGNVYNSQDMAAMEIMANELAIAIQNALQFEEIQKFTVTLQETVEEKTRQLRRSNEKLKAMDETKDEFISMASHQLRTPLTSVKGYVSMVLEGDAGDLNDMQKKLLDQAFVSSQRMVYLIADLLNVSRLRTGKFIIDSVPTNLADVVQGEVDQLIDTAASRNLELTYKKPDNFPMLMMDETKIRQVVMNFIDNSIYYTPAGGHITVNLKEVGDSVEYTVTDDGLGVPKSEQHHLFNKFFRAGNAKKARPDGTGLGLFMAKKVIVAQGGSIIFKSTEGKGSTFGFSFSKDKLKVPDHYEPAESLNGIKSGPGATPKKDPSK